jgi:DNA helicase HerA-like ATPase
MTVSSLLRKLEPLLPKEVDRWRRALPLVNEQTKRLIEQHVIMTARRLLGDHERRLLLPPPPASKAKGPIRLGTVLYDGERGPFGISESELLQHLAIFGRSGAGKTNVVFGLLMQLAERRIPFLFLDWKRTGRHLLPLLTGKVSVFTVGRCRGTPHPPR